MKVLGKGGRKRPPPVRNNRVTSFVSDTWQVRTPDNRKDLLHQDGKGKDTGLGEASLSSSMAMVPTLKLSTAGVVLVENEPGTSQ